MKRIIIPLAVVLAIFIVAPMVMFAAGSQQATPFSGKALEPELAKVTVETELVATSIVLIQAPLGQDTHEAKAKIRFNLTAVGGDVYVSQIRAGVSPLMHSTLALFSDAEHVGESGLWLVSEGQTKWFEVRGLLKNTGEKPVFARMWVDEIHGGTSTTKPEAHSVEVNFETSYIFLHPKEN